MLTILKIHLPTDTPIVGCDLKPYVLVRRADSTVSTEDVPEGSQPEGSQCLRSRWYRSGNSRKTPVCSVHPSEAATLQCIGCLKSKVPVQKSYHCSQKCFVACWPDHKNWHANPSSTGLPCTEDDSSHYRNPMGSNGDEGLPEWVLVGQGRTYTPTSDDIGHTLKFEVTPFDSQRNAEDAPTTVVTGRVIPPPNPPARNLLPVEGSPANSHPSSFTVMTYNVLADLYATSEMYTYCPGWALSWGYRKQALLREILSQRADIICLQEVQSDHYEEFFAPEMKKAGYTAVYKMKTAAVYTGSAYTIDGCATFFRTDRFTLVKKYEVEFNKAALSLSEALSAANQKKAALNRLLKDNVALIVVLDSLEGPDPDAAAVGKRQLVCVANTHIHANPELKDVKLWQVHTLLKGLEKIAASADIPMLVTGDFNSTPGSAPHSLLANGRVDASHPELATDPLGILRPPSKLCHQLPLMSAYASMASPGISSSVGRGEAEKQMRRVDTTNQEPLFTNYGADFTGTLDYLFYTANSLVPTKLLELPDKSDVQMNGHGMPNNAWSSDHIALMAEFQFKTQ
uniref:Endonuclease/exonuclease/phosphatase domain-containing protein n=1 Tax=Pyramimonas obovata TaxID=1411642 RepID=A0A7S0R3W3_9CHLO|mmetsp:Transcript_25134/g.54690  ORF Transcript_25134/g.54690 Transcript_25134/m.54690 type:complete len:569 (+) Transcript_25134:456-2162(+)